MRRKYSSSALLKGCRTLLRKKIIEFYGSNVQQMKKAGPAILGEVDAALEEYFGDYEVFLIRGNVICPH